LIWSLELDYGMWNVKSSLSKKGIQHIAGQDI
jgi:hypothetical protein